LINTDFSNAQEELLSVPSRIHTEQSLRTFSSWGGTQIYNTIRDSFVYNLDLRKIKADEIIEKPYIIDNDDNTSVHLSRVMYRLFSDNTIKALYESGWEGVYQTGSKIRKYYIHHIFDSMQIIVLKDNNYLSIEYILPSFYTEQDLSLVGTNLDNVDNFWAKYIKSYNNYYLYASRNNLLYCYTNDPSLVISFSGCNKTAAQHTAYSFVKVYQHPSNIKSMLTGYRNAAIITEYSIVEPYFDGTTSIFSTEHVFTSAIKDSCLVDTFGSELPSSASWYVLLENGELWVKGDNTYGQLGINSDDAYIADWVKVDRLFDQISVGYYVIRSNIISGRSVRQNTFVYGIDKETSYVYAWGASTHCYPLGIDSTSKVSIPTLILSEPVVKIQSTKMSDTNGVYPNTDWDTYITAGGILLTRSKLCYIVGNARKPSLGDYYGGIVSPSSNNNKSVRRLLINEPIVDIYIQSNIDYTYSLPANNTWLVKALLIAESGNLYSLNSLAQYYFNRVL
jgi:hypothetical protein